VTRPETGTDWILSLPQPEKIRTSKPSKIEKLFEGRQDMANVG
jgi:hypothetical protein